METGKKLAAGVMPICSTTGRILLVRRGMHQSNPGTWACFGGKFDDGIDKNPKQTAKREFVEESRYTGKYKISRFPLYVNKDNHSEFYTYVGIFNEEFTPDIESEGEAMDYGWFYIDEMPDSLLNGFKEMIDKKNQTIKNIICFYSGKC